jgi:hypothetical protein
MTVISRIARDPFVELDVTTDAVTPTERKVHARAFSEHEAHRPYEQGATDEDNDRCGNVTAQQVPSKAEGRSRRGRTAMLPGRESAVANQGHQADERGNDHGACAQRETEPGSLPVEAQVDSSD